MFATYHINHFSMITNRSKTLFKNFCQAVIDQNLLKSAILLANQNNGMKYISINLFECG